MKNISKFLLATVVAISLMVSTNVANAALIKTALAIVIDGSGSIGSTDFATQRSAYANVLGDASIVKADGSVVINVFQFASGTALEQTAIRLNNEADRTTLINSVNAMTQLGGGTNIGGGIAAAYTNMDTYLASLLITDFTPSFSKVIDVSTDGAHNTGLLPATATSNAIGLGYLGVNCLGIGGSADCSWNASGLDFSATTFAEVQAALKLKIGTELGTVPEPSALLVMLFGLLGLGAARRVRVG